uniref:Ig-like domain-containing protein n=1 Tax=Chrysemys picta bellii TaxID=8478 RepID=A0A8C3HU49_CHRPI
MDGLNGSGGAVGVVSPLFNSYLLLKAGCEFLKPTIWVSPSRVVALGGSVTIRCEGRQRSMEFFLGKAGHPNQQVRTVPDGTVAEFPITNVGQEDGGSYTCHYRSLADQNRWSYPSDPVDMIVGELSYPKPSISLSPSVGVSLGGAVTVRCRGQHQGVQFVLNKEQRHFPPADSDGFEAVFPISNVSREDGGNYSCSYHSRSEPFAVSYPSEPVELVVRGQGPASASPFPGPPHKPDPHRGLEPMGCSEPGSALSPDPEEGSPASEGTTPEQLESHHAPPRKAVTRPVQLPAVPLLLPLPLPVQRSSPAQLLRRKGAQLHHVTELSGGGCHVTLLPPHHTHTCVTSAWVLSPALAGEWV